MSEEEKQKAKEELGWLYIHGASAGGMSIAAWEMLRHALSGVTLFLVYGGVTLGSLASVLIHHKVRNGKVTND